MRSFKLLLLNLLILNSLLMATPKVKAPKEDIYVREDMYDDVGGFLCSCYVKHYCVQIGVYNNQKNLNRAIKIFDKSKKIKFFTIESFTQKGKKSHRLLAHSKEYFVSKKEAMKLLSSVKKHISNAFIVKRLYFDEQEI